MFICDVLRDLVPFVEFKDVKNTYRGVLLLVKLDAKSCIFRQIYLSTIFSNYRNRNRDRAGRFFAAKNVFLCSTETKHIFHLILTLFFPKKII